MVEIDIPSGDNIAELPKGAQIALAARCVRRVLPLFKAVWPDAPDEHIEAIRSAVEMVEASPPREVLCSTALVVALEDANTAARHISSKIAYAVLAAAFAADALDPDDTHALAAYHVDTCGTSGAVQATVQAATLFADTPDAHAKISAVIWSDFRKIKTTAEEEGWSDYTYVPPEFFGEMWPEGIPTDWETRQNEQNVPAKGEIALLPRGAQVAFAARCARRVFPLFKAYCLKAPKENIARVQRAIETAENAFPLSTAPSHSLSLNSSIGAFFSSAFAAPPHETDQGGTHNASARAAASAAHAATTAWLANEAVSAPAERASYASDSVSTAASGAAYIAAEAARAINDEVRARTIVAFQRDLEKLNTFAQKEGWDDNTQVPPEFLGEMWPDGLPQGWPVEDPKREKVQEKPGVLKGFLRTVADSLWGK